MIKKLGLLFSLSAFCLAAAGDTPGWNTLQSAEGRFSVALPGKAQTMKKPVQTKTGPVDMNVFLVPMGRDAVYFVCYCDFPSDKIGSTEPQTILDGARDGIVKNQSRQITSEKRITLDGNPGREFLWVTPDSMTGRARVYLADNRLYQTMVLWRNGRAPGLDPQKFLDSFKIR